MDEQSEKYQKAKARVGALKGFYTHLIMYVLINVLLIVVNLVTSPGTLWFYWVTIFWGIGLVIHAVDTFTIRGKYLGEEWEEKKIKEMMGEDKEEKK
jgi:hypothetical protein